MQKNFPATSRHAAAAKAMELAANGIRDDCLQTVCGAATHPS
jgi:hypothetical protein